jgi:hypothetical protein
MTQFSSTKVSPKTIRHIAMESSARSGAVTDPISALSDQRRCA